jgi:hypothetical protein
VKARTLFPMRSVENYAPLTILGRMTPYGQVPALVTQTRWGLPCVAKYGITAIGPHGPQSASLYQRGSVRREFASCTSRRIGSQLVLKKGTVLWFLNF